MTFELRTFSGYLKFVKCFSAFLSNANLWENACSTDDLVYEADSFKEQ